MAVARAVAIVGPQQKDNLCGSYCSARVLTELGYTTWDGEAIDQDLIAVRSRATLPRPGPPPCVPPGASSLMEYRFELPMVEDDAVGTSPIALATTIEAASRGGLRCVPLRGPWTAGQVEQLVDRASAMRARLIANLRTGALWSSRPPQEAVLGELTGLEVTDPSADWDVGHFVELEMVLRGPARALVVVRDTYPTLGWGGRHLQPARLVAAALQRGDGREGGILFVATATYANHASQIAGELGLDIGFWNNGCRS